MPTESAVAMPSAALPGLNPSRTLIFDFDGTIADTLSAIIRNINEHAEEFKIRPLDAKDVEDLRGLSNAEIARKIYDLRKAAGLSQRALAELVGTTASVICRLEDADYEGHSLAMLQRIASAVNKRVEIRFVSRQTALRPA